MSIESQTYSASFNPLRRPLNLRESVLEQLRTAIITGGLAEGTVVSAPTLGQALGVSATPVREAMMDLAREGLAEFEDGVDHLAFVCFDDIIGLRKVNKFA